MEKKKNPDRFIKKPIYPGGPSAMRKFIYSELIYPKAAKENKTEGTVHARYEVNHMGTVTAVKILAHVPDGCDDEAIRIIKKLKFKVPKTPRKLRVNFQKTIRIHFRLPASAVPSQKPQQQATTFQYTIVPAASSQPKKSSAAKSTVYTIKINTK